MHVALKGRSTSLVPRLLFAGRTREKCGLGTRLQTRRIVILRLNYGKPKVDAVHSSESVYCVLLKKIRYTFRCAESNELNFILTELHRRRNSPALHSAVIIDMAGSRLLSFVLLLLSSCNWILVGGQKSCSISGMLRWRYKHCYQVYNLFIYLFFCCSC